MTEAPPRIKSLIEVFRLPRETIYKTYSPYFYTYFKGYFSDPGKISRKLKEMQQLLKRIGPCRGTLADVGCGFGLEAVILSHLLTDDRDISAYARPDRGPEVVGIDHNEEKVRLARTLARQSGAKNISFRLQGGKDTAGNWRADTLLCRDVISHVNDVEIFLDSLVKNLNPGGILYLIDDRNSLSPLTVWATRRLQKKMEGGRPDAARQREIDTGKNFFQVRREMIGAHFRFPPPKLERYARMTAGLYGKQIIAFVKALERGENPSPPPFKYVNPQTGESCERLYNPFGIKKKLEKMGLRVSVERPFLGFSRGDKGLKKWAAWGIELLHPLSLFFSPLYHIKARKEQNRKR